MPDHWALIMARGQSRRMGVPKGLVSLAEGGPPLLALVDDLYRHLGWPRLVVTLADLVVPYEGVLCQDAQRFWLGAEPGGETARTIQLGYRFLADRMDEEDFLWIHPVDLPLVRPETLVHLRSTLEETAVQGIRPRYGNQPGHPVVLKVALLRQMFGDQEAPVGGTMKEQLHHLPLALCPVEDEGVITDFDDPRGIASWQECT
jgi:CTP:molybdopterin cytidylyltransferase MocA